MKPHHGRIIRYAGKKAVYAGMGYGLWALKKAGQAHRAVMALKKLLNVEKKYFDVSSGGSLSSTQIIPLFYPAQGDGGSDRDGISARLKQVDVRIQLYNPSGGSAMTYFNQVRVLLILDKQCNGSNPTITNILASDNSMTAHRNLALATRFRTFYDRVHKVTTSTQDPASNKFIHLHKTLNLKTIFTGSSSSVSDISTYNLLLVLIPDSTGAGSLPDYAYSSRCRFVDN